MKNEADFLLDLSRVEIHCVARFSQLSRAVDERTIGTAKGFLAVHVFAVD